MQFIMQNLESKQYFWEWEQKMQGSEKIKCTVSFQVKAKIKTSNVKNYTETTAMPFLSNEDWINSWAFNDVESNSKY